MAGPITLKLTFDESEAYDFVDWMDGIYADTADWGAKEMADQVRRQLRKGIYEDD